MNAYFEKQGRKEFLIIEDAHIMFPNFRGIPDQYTVKGHRHFCVELPEDIANELAEAGWNIKHTNPKKEEYQSVPYTDINIQWNYEKNKLPVVTFITSGNETEVDEELVGDLDKAEIERIDLAIDPSYWKRQDGSWGIKGYVKTLDAYLYEDPIRRRRAERQRAAREAEVPFEE